MKKILLLTICGLLLISCGGGDKWSSADKAKFTKEMKREITGMYPEETIHDFCDCLLDAAMDKWSSYEDLDNDTYDAGYEWGFNASIDCAQKLGIEF